MLTSIRSISEMKEENKIQDYDAELILRPNGVVVNEPAERRRSAGEAADNSAARRIAYAKKFESVSVRCKM